MPVTDTYATARANLRDNTKTLITVFGAVSGVILVGSPFTGYGALEPLSERWVLATVSGLVAVALIGLCVFVLLRVLRPETAFLGALKNDFDIKSVPRLLRPEVKALRYEFSIRARELLSKGYTTYEAQDAAADAAWLAYDANRTEDNLKRYNDINDPLIKIANWSAFVRLHYRTSLGINVTMILGLLALSSLGVFAWAVGEKPKAAPPTIVLVQPPAPIAPAPKPPLPAPEQVLFGLGKWELTVEGLAAVNRIRNAMKTHPDASVLVYGHTDTIAGLAVNQQLARRRVASVVNALTREGGVAWNRVLASELPETDLPLVTTQESNQPANRSVQMVLVRVPQ